MKIEAITLRELQIPLVHFFETSFGRTYDRRVLLVTLQGDGLEGWGECVAGEDPYYSEEYIDGAWEVIVRYLGPSLLGMALNAGRGVSALLARVREHRMAKAALENAAWDAEAQEKGIPLWELLGGSRREIACGVSIGIQDSHEQLLQKIETELAAGYQRIKQGEARLGSGRAGEGAGPVARRLTELRRQLGLYAQRSGALEVVRPFQAADDRATPVE
jgi:O-succinylbenzoate synthase